MVKCLKWCFILHKKATMASDVGRKWWKTRITGHYCNKLNFQEDISAAWHLLRCCTVQTSAAGGGRYSVYFLHRPRCFIHATNHHAYTTYIQCKIEFFIETRPIHGEILWAFYRALCRCTSRFKRQHSWELPARPRCKPWKRRTGC